MPETIQLLLYIVVGLTLGPIAVYLAARLITAAFFKSKQQYERYKHHGA